MRKDRSDHAVLITAWGHYIMIEGEEAVREVEVLMNSRLGYEVAPYRGGSYIAKENPFR